MAQPINVWNEIRITTEGISVTLFSEYRDGGTIVEDETWFTFAELEAMKGDFLSLQLSDETRENIDEGIEAANDGRDESEIGRNLPQEGDIAYDHDAPSWSNDRRVEVVAVTDIPADEYPIAKDVLGNRITVADRNPAYDPEAPVVEGKYVEGSDTVYAFPAGRLEGL